jgi:hypothetical protein
VEWVGATTPPPRRAEVERLPSRPSANTDQPSRTTGTPRDGDATGTSHRDSGEAVAPCGPEPNALTINAATPAACGEAIDVPDAVPYHSTPLPPQKYLGIVE